MAVVMPTDALSARTPAGRPRVLLADDHTQLVEVVAQLLSPECDIVGTVGDGWTLVAEAERLKPDVIVVDISMPLLNGLDAARQVKRTLPRTKLVFLTMNEDPELSAEAFRIGASAFLLKCRAACELITAIRTAVSA